MVRYHILEHRECRRYQQYILNLPNVGQPGFYRQGVSIDAFRKHWGTVLLEQGHFFSGRRFSVRDPADIELERAHTGEYKKLFQFFSPDTVTLEFMSIWAFYCYIGWDHRRKQFLT